MPYPSGDIVKYVIGGTAASDTWSIGIWQSLSGLTGTPTPAQMNAAALSRLNGFNTGVWSAATNPLKSANSPAVALGFCKSYLYRSGVLTAQGSSAITPVPGAATYTIPLFSAMCTTLLTGVAGRSYRGRLYLPLTGVVASSTTGQIGATQQGIITNLGSILTGYGPDDNLYPGDPTSFAGVLSQSRGAITKIQSLRADSLYDTQHGRTNKDVATSFWTASV